MAKSRSRKAEEPEKPKIPNDAYVGLLGISLVALIAGAVFMYIDHEELMEKKVSPPAMSLSTDGLGGGAAKAGTRPGRN